MPLQLNNSRSFVIAILITTMFFARSTRAFLRPAVTPHRLAKNTVRYFTSVHIATPDQVLNIFNKPGAIILDVRSQPEIDTQGCIQTWDKNLWVQVSCTPTECPSLPGAAEKMFPDKQSE